MLFSLIFPVYNVEKYVKKSIQSILNQTYRNFELIIVNDGSKDKSIDIIQEEIKNVFDLDIRIITKDNGGLSSARNAGLSNVKGDFILMIDSDDIISNDFLSCFKELLDEYPESNIYSLNFKKWPIKKGEYCFPYTNQISPVSMTWQQSQISYLRRNPVLLVTALMLRKSFLDQYKIRFDETIKYSEDGHFIWKCLGYNKNNVIYSKSIKYCYILHPNSIMSSSNLDKILTGFYELNDFFAKDIHLYCEEVRPTLVSRYYLGLLHSSAKLLNRKDYLFLCKKTNSIELIRPNLNHGSPALRFLVLLFLISKNLTYYILKYI